MWKELFDVGTLKKGERIQDDCITFLKVDNTEITAQVLGTQLYEVKIDSHLNMSCSCPWCSDAGFYCKHLACVLLKNDKNGSNGIPKLEFDYSKPEFVDKVKGENISDLNIHNQLIEENMECGVVDNIAQIIPSVVEKYWCYGLNKIKPNEVSIFTKDKYYWRNSTGVLFHRAPLDIDVPSNQSSRGEAFLYCLLKQIFPDTLHREIISKTEMDIFVPSIKLAVKYDGSYYHKNKLEQDLQKNKRLNELGIYVIRVREKGCPDLVDKDNIAIESIYVRSPETIKDILRAISKHIRKTKINVPPSILKKLTKYSPDDYDLSDENVGKCYILRSDDSDTYSNERIRNYCFLHKDDIFTKEAWEKFLVLTKSIPMYRLTANNLTDRTVRIFEGVKDENVAKSYYEALYLLNKRPFIDFNAIDDIEYLKEKYKNLIDEGNGASFITVLNVAIKDYETSVVTNKDKEKIALLLNLVDYFKRMFPEHYMMLQLLKAEYRLKIILEPNLHTTSNIVQDKKSFIKQWNINIKDFYISDVTKMFSENWYLSNIHVSRMEINEGIVRAKVAEPYDYDIEYNTVIKIESFKIIEKYQLPKKEELTFECDCNSNEIPCKHILAVLYTISDKERRGLKVFESLL